MLTWRKLYTTGSANERKSTTKPRTTTTKPSACQTAWLTDQTPPDCSLQTPLQIGTTVKVRNTRKCSPPKHASPIHLPRTPHLDSCTFSFFGYLSLTSFVFKCVTSCLLPGRSVGQIKVLHLQSRKSAQLALWVGARIRMAPGHTAGLRYSMETSSAASESLFWTRTLAAAGRLLHVAPLDSLQGLSSTHKACERFLIQTHPLIVN